MVHLSFTQKQNKTPIKWILIIQLYDGWFLSLRMFILNSQTGNKTNINHGVKMIYFARQRELIVFFVIV